MKLILASASPRRFELMTRHGYDFDVMVTDTDECVRESVPPHEYALIVSMRKAVAAAEQYDGDACIIAADTIVETDGVILGKPADESDAFAMLKRLSGKTHNVYTAISIAFKCGRDVQYRQSCTKTSVTFAELSDGDISDYIATGEPMGKAGAYAIQGIGARLVQSIDGDYDNVVGLPMKSLQILLNGGNMIRAAIVGYGNIGRYVLNAVQSAPDMELAGVVRRAESVGNNPKELDGIKVVANIKELGKVDVAILCCPTTTVPDTAADILAQGINTVDSYDIHTTIYELKQKLDPIAKANNVAAIIAAGWDPGSDSVVRAMLQAIAPKGITYTNFGPGMSMGHTVAVKAIKGVKKALSMTIPKGTGLHRRMVYIELEDGANFAETENLIKTDPYFVKDETHVIQVPNVDDILDMGHGVSMTRKGVSGTTDNQLFEFNMKINNPALTAQILVCVARAVMLQKSGCYTMIEVPVIDLLHGDREQLIRTLV